MCHGSSLREYLKDHRELLKPDAHPVANDIEDLLTICVGVDAAGPQPREHGHHSPDINGRKNVHAELKRERKNAYAELKRCYSDHGQEMTEKILALEANAKWNTRDPVAKWKRLQDRPGDDSLIRSAMKRLTERVTAAKPPTPAVVPPQKS